jgi:hypothetical protein
LNRIARDLRHGRNFADHHRTRGTDPKGRLGQSDISLPSARTTAMKRSPEARIPGLWDVQMKWLDASGHPKFYHFHRELHSLG